MEFKKGRLYKPNTDKYSFVLLSNCPFPRKRQVEVPTFNIVEKEKPNLDQFEDLVFLKHGHAFMFLEKISFKGYLPFYSFLTNQGKITVSFLKEKSLRIRL